MSRWGFKRVGRVTANDKCIMFQIGACLIEHNAKVNVRDVDGYTPLHMSAAKGNTDFVKLLGQVSVIEVETHLQ